MYRYLVSIWLLNKCCSPLLVRTYTARHFTIIFDIPNKKHRLSNTKTGYAHQSLRDFSEPHTQRSARGETSRKKEKIWRGGTAGFARTETHQQSRNVCRQNIKAREVHRKVLTVQRPEAPSKAFMSEMWGHFLIYHWPIKRASASVSLRAWRTGLGRIPNDSELNWFCGFPSRLDPEDVRSL